MTKTKRAIAIIILMLVLGATLFGCAQNADYRTPAYFAGKYSNEIKTFSLTVIKDGETLLEDDRITHFAEGGYYAYSPYNNTDIEFIKSSLNNEVISVIESISNDLGYNVKIKRQSVKLGGSKKDLRIKEYVFLEDSGACELRISLDTSADYIDNYLIIGTYYRDEQQKLNANWIAGVVTGTITCKDGSQYQYTFDRGFAA